MPVGLHRVPKLSSLNGVGDLSGCRAARECRILEHRRLERGEDERLRVVMQKHLALCIQQIKSYWHYRRVNVSRTAKVRWISHHVVEPCIPVVTASVKPRSLIRAIPVRKGIDSRSPVGIAVNAGIALTMRRYSDKSGMSIRKMVGWKLVGILRHSDDCANQSDSRQKHAECESRRQVHITDLLNWNFLFVPQEAAAIVPPNPCLRQCARIFMSVAHDMSG